MTPDLVFRIGSVTKTFVSARVLLLVESGEVALDDPLEKYVPGFPNGAAITVRQVMNHTSGIFNYTDDPTWQMQVNMDPAHVWKPADLVAVAAANPPYFAPGMGWTYSNTDYILLGELIENVTKNHVGAEIRSKLLDPLHLDHTSFDGEEPVKGTLAHGYQGNFDVTTLIDPSFAWAAGAMVSSAADLLAWEEALYGGKVLAAATMQELLTAVPTGSKGLSYGLGVMVLDKSIALDTAYGHGGDIPGFHTQMFYFPAENFALADVVSSDGVSPNPITAALIEGQLKP